MMIQKTATNILHSLVQVKKGELQADENKGLQDEIDGFFEQFDHLKGEVFAMFDDLADDILNKNFPENQMVRLYDYDAFLCECVQEDINSYGSDYVEGFNRVFDWLSSDEQKKFVFHNYIKHSTRFDSNNSREWQHQLYHDSKNVYYDRCLFFVLEIL